MRKTLTTIVAVGLVLSLAAPAAWALSEDVKHPKIFFPKTFDAKKAEQIHTALRREKLGFQGGLISYWQPKWSTTLVYNGDTTALRSLLKELSAVAGMRVKVSFSKDLSKETRGFPRSGNWWVVYSHVTPEMLTVRVNLAAKDIDASQLELWADGETRPPGALLAEAFSADASRPRALALELVRDVAAGRRTVVLSADELVYYGGGISAYPKDMLYTSITINWRMIEAERAAEPADDIGVAVLAAVLMVKDDASGIIVSVKPDEQTLTAKDAKSKVLWETNVIKAAGPPGVGKPAVRHLSIKNGRVTAVYGKHSFAELELRTGKFLASGSD